METIGSDDSDSSVRCRRRERFDPFLTTALIASLLKGLSRACFRMPSIIKLGSLFYRELNKFKYCYLSLWNRLPKKRVAERTCDLTTKKYHLQVFSDYAFKII